ncbi:MAG: GNAT family N-acetyltransferase [Spirosomaceae bacterium]|jgi:GNAT superfamily N-acetyltransferase|nr:GNAT family N-acetyltransferase [Spirosomataceae bacterium]
MNILYTTATSNDDLEQILSLQRQNLYKNTPLEYQQDQGFTTVEHSFEVLQQMNAAIPQIIAKEDDKVIGYALVMPQSFSAMIPELVPMFEQIVRLDWLGKQIQDYRFYVMGQICVAESHRGQGVFDGLYNAHKRLLSADFDLCVTEVATRNTRSSRAHERVGFRTIHTYQDHTDVWNVVVWDWG